MQTSLLFHAFGFSLGFIWVCRQIGVELPKIMKSLAGGFVLGAAALYVAPQHAAFLPAAGLLGSTLLLWLQAREQLAQKISRDSVYLLSLTYVYFFSSWHGYFRIVGLLSAAPCALVLIFCFHKKHIDSSARVGLMFWAMLVSLVMGVQQILSSPEALVPVKNLHAGLASGSNLINAALQAAGLLTLAFSLVPFIDWVRGLVLRIPDTANHQMMDENFSFRRVVTLTVVHVAPLFLNWKYQYCSFDTMLGYALVWSPIISAAIANAFLPEAPSEIPGWDQNSTQAS